MRSGVCACDQSLMDIIMRSTLHERVQVHVHLSAALQGRGKVGGTGSDCMLVGGVVWIVPNAV